MGKETLVEEIRKTLTNFINEICSVNMAMLIKDIDTDSYTFLIGSTFLDIVNPYDGTKLVAEYFYKSLPKNAFSIISRINLVNTKDPSMHFIYRACCVRGGIVNIKDCTFFNVYLEDVILLESHMD